MNLSFVAPRFIPLKEVLWTHHEVNVSGVAAIESGSRLATECGILGNRQKHTVEAVGCVTWQGRKRRKGDAPDVATGEYAGVRPAVVKKKRAAARMTKDETDNVEAVEETAVVDAGAEESAMADAGAEDSVVVDAGGVVDEEVGEQGFRQTMTICR